MWGKPMNRLSVLLVIILASPTHAQEKMLWGNLSGKVTDKKTEKPVADAIIFLKLTKGAFPIHPDDKKQKDIVIQIPAGRNFDFRMLAHFPYYLDGDKKVSTGQKFTLIGDAQQDHAFQFATNYVLTTNQADGKKLKHHFQSGDPHVLFSETYIAAGERYDAELKHLAGYRVQSQFYREMMATVFVFNHPYFAITKKDGSFTIPRAPAGTELIVFGWHEDTGYLLTKSGKAMTLKEGKNSLDVSAERN
jgi:hypothetical protein